MSGKLNKSAPVALHAYKHSKNGPQTSTFFNSVLDSRSILTEIKICYKYNEAVCNCNANVSCLSFRNYDEIQQIQKRELQPCHRKLHGANG